MEKLATPPPTELTLRAVILGVVLSVVMGGANVYLGLKVGMTVTASIPAAVVGMLILRSVFRSHSVLEANQVQTAASAGESLAAGVIFTLPAIVMIGAWERFDLLVSTLIAAAGGLLGILFMIPMRKVFVVANDAKLPFPEAVACAAVLRAGQTSESSDEAMTIIKGAGLGVAFKVLGKFFGVFYETVEGALRLGGRVFYLGGDISPALIAVGLIVRLNVALLIFIGGVMSWLVGIPLLAAPNGGDPLDTAWTLWSTQVRYVGVGAMVVGGVESIYKVRRGLVEAVAKLTAPRNTPNHAIDETERDLPGGVIATLAAVSVALVAAVYYLLTDSVAITAVVAVIMVVMSFFFTAVASYIVALVGNSNSPVSGMTITALLFTGAMLLVFGFSGTQGMVATLGVAAIVCCVASTSGDVCNDLKTGHLVGAAPFRQQFMQVLGVVFAAIVMAPILQLLHSTTPGGIGGRELSAPQASLFASLAKGFFGDGVIPWSMVIIGAAVGAVMVAIDATLARREASFRLYVMPVAVGMYLPFGIAIPILAGGIVAHLVQKRTRGKTADQRLHRGVLFASGAIAGESLTGIALAIPAFWGVQKLPLGLPPAASTVLGLVAAAVAIWAFHRASRPVVS